MIRTIRAEFRRLLRRRTVIGLSLLIVIVGLAAPIVVFGAAKPAATVDPTGYTPTLESLARAGGGTQVFRYAAAFFGTMVFAVFVGTFALEYARGTYRTMLLRQPRRIRLLTGRLVAMLIACAMVLAATELAVWIGARLQAPGKHISTSAWTTGGALGAAVSDYSIVLLWVTGYAVLALAAAVLLRSVPVALGAGIAWAGPIEHLTRNALPSAAKVLPGLSLEIVGQRGIPNVTMTHATVVVLLYTVAAGIIAATVFTRRDVTA